MASTNFLFLFISIIAILVATTTGVAPDLAKLNVSTLIIFGDSTVDTGNNNYLPHSFMKANHPPYGLNFPNHIPTGRFCDGKMIPDILASKFGIKETIPPYKSCKDKPNELLTGVCFASAGTGWDDLTATISGVYTMDDEVNDFDEYIRRVKMMVGEEKAIEIVRRAFVLLSIGTNDFMVNYNTFPFRRFTYDFNEYQSFLLDKMRVFIEKIYNLGVRRLAVTGLPPIGCVPLVMTQAAVTPGPSIFARGCVNHMNDEAMAYNTKIQTLLKTMQQSLLGIKIAYIDVYTALMNLIKDPASYGFEMASRGCCGTGYVEIIGLCGDRSTVCPNPSKYVFFDSVHPSEAAYRHLIDTVMGSVVSQVM